MENNARQRRQERRAARSVEIPSIYRSMKKPAKVGQPRVKAWRYAIEPLEHDDPTWKKRIRDYWTLQERTYGFVVGTIASGVDYDAGLVFTSARVIAVLPGERRADYSALPN